MTTPREMQHNMLLLHLTVFIWGFTGILGSLISISAVYLVWYRVLIAFVSLYIYLLIRRQTLTVSRTDLIRFLLTGGLVGLHWVLFFHSIKVSKVSVTLVCLSSLTIFTAFLEPLFYRRKTDMTDIITGLVVITGICLIFTFETQYLEGIILGLLCSLCASLFSIINSKLVKQNSATVISFYEMAGAWVWISLYMLLTDGFAGGMALKTDDLIYLLLLGTVCTSAAYAAGVQVMRKLSAFTVALATNLEQIYGILLALLLFGKSEYMSAGFYAGAVLILLTVFLQPVYKAWRKV